MTDSIKHFNNELISKLILGSVQFGLDYGVSNTNGKTNFKEAEAILNTAFDFGIRFVDTAQAYGNCEEIIGKLNRNRFKIITKLNLSNGLSSKESIKSSFDKLKSKRIYSIMIHNVNDGLKSTRILKELQYLKEKEQIEKIGFSLYTIEELETLIETYGEPDLIQIPYNYLDRRFEPYMKHLKSKNVEIHIRSVFLQGLLFLKSEELPVYFKPMKGFIENLRDLLQTDQEIASSLLNFVLNQPFVDKVIFGVNTKKQLEQNINGILKLKKQLDLETPQFKKELLVPSLWPKN